MKQAFVDKTFSAGSLLIIAQANRILDEYKAQGFILTLRQLFYQFVARGIIANKQSEYKRLGSITNDARLAGLIDWDMIEDRTRNLEKPPSWSDPESLIGAAADQYRFDMWSNQPFHVEVWIEKEALVGVIEPVCQELRLPYFACRGYGSQSELWRAGTRFRSIIRYGRKVLVLHLGDHDPSGIDMTRDNEDRLRMFAKVSFNDSALEVRRLALNVDQVEQYNPPPNPAKIDDSRYEGYVARFGEESWELDALEPSAIADMISTNANSVIDQEQWSADAEQEENDRNIMQNVAARWSEAVERFG